MRVAISAKLKNGPLWEAAQKMGGIRKLAAHLGLRYEFLIALINMRAYPAFRNKHKKSRINWADVETKLLTLTGLMLEDIFPGELAQSEFMERPLVYSIIKDIPTEQLLAAHERLALPAAQIDLVESHEAERVLASSIASLRPNEQQVINFRFGLNGEDEHTLSECAKALGKTPERIRQIEIKALNKLRSGNRRVQLLEAYDPERLREARARLSQTC